MIALLRISQPGAATHRGARYHLSDRHHRWQYSLGEIIQSWTPADLTLSIAQSLEKVSLSDYLLFVLSHFLS